METFKMKATKSCLGNKDQKQCFCLNRRYSLVLTIDFTYPSKPNKKR